MTTTRRVELTIAMYVEIDTEQLEYGVTGGAEDEYTITQAVTYIRETVADRIDGNIKIEEKGITLLNYEYE